MLTVNVRRQIAKALQAVLLAALVCCHGKAIRKSAPDGVSYECNPSRPNPCGSEGVASGAIPAEAAPSDMDRPSVVEQFAEGLSEATREVLTAERKDSARLKWWGKYYFAGAPKAQANAVRELENIGYAVGYSEGRKDPLWAGYYVAPVAITEVIEERPKSFGVDLRTAARVVHTDYTQPDYRTNPRAFDRGHMAPNYAIASRYGRAAQLETFLLSNVCPEQKRLNQQTWEALEKRIAREYAPECDGVWVLAGPIFDALENRRLNGIAEIPDRFYCIVVDDDEGYVRVLAVVMSQGVYGIHQLDDFVTTVDAIESATGLDFFSELPDDVESTVEARGPDGDWELSDLLIPSHH
jgi:endonuclease G